MEKYILLELKEFKIFNFIDLFNDREELILSFKLSKITNCIG